MGQEATQKTLTPDSDLKDGKVRPRSKVKIVTLNSKYHAVPNTVEAVHPSLAAKLVEQGKARYGDRLSAEEKDANRQFLESKVTSKGRKPGKAEEGDEFDELVDDKAAVKGKAK